MRSKRLQKSNFTFGYFQYAFKKIRYFQEGSNQIATFATWNFQEPTLASSPQVCHFRLALELILAFTVFRRSQRNPITVADARTDLISRSGVNTSR